MYRNVVNFLGEEEHCKRAVWKAGARQGQYRGSPMQQKGQKSCQSMGEKTGKVKHMRSREGKAL